ncbi:unnamed protein product [Mytilus coruscus]|uniref:Uncharacterized protein n=1 Tax=Mytilus coruscus TaxID=42192 RepID=A0A6J8ADY0_MYTCO|nr:unnamed protein product [Mytilus coruscus]
MRSLEEDRKETIKKLEHDIRNSLNHIYGEHSNCYDICKTRTTANENTPTLNINEEKKGNFGTECIFQEQTDMWTAGSNVEEQEEARLSSNLIPSYIDSEMRREIAILLNNIAKKSSNLIGNFTSNLAESWMHMRTKFDGGQMYNHCNRGSWHTRCYGAALRNNLGPLWSLKVWVSSTQSTSGHYFQKLYNTREKNININNTSKSKPEIKQNRWKRKMKASKEATSRKAKKQYGKECIQAENDISPQQLETIKENFYTTEIDITPSEIKKIELETTSQSISTNWSEQRKKRLTSSKFGRIVKRNSKLPVAKLLSSLLYCTFSGNKSTRFWTESGKNYYFGIYSVHVKEKYIYQN